MLTDWPSYLILLSRQGKVVGHARPLVAHPISGATRRGADGLTDEFFSLQRLAKWFTTLSPKEKAKIIKDVTQLVLSRRTRMCNFLEYKGMPLQMPPWPRPPGSSPLTGPLRQIPRSSTVAMPPSSSSPAAPPPTTS